MSSDHSVETFPFPNERFQCRKRPSQHSFSGHATKLDKLSFHSHSDQGPRSLAGLSSYLNLLSFPSFTHTSRVPGSAEQEEVGRTLRQVGVWARPAGILKAPVGAVRPRLQTHRPPRPSNAPKPVRANPQPARPWSALLKPGCQPAVPGSSRLSCPSHYPRLDHPRAGACSLSTHARPLLRRLLPAWKGLFLPMAAILPGHGRTDTSPPPQTAQRGPPRAPSTTAGLGPKSLSGSVQ